MTHHVHILFKFFFFFLIHFIFIFWTFWKFHFFQKTDFQFSDFFSTWWFFYLFFYTLNYVSILSQKWLEHIGGCSCPFREVYSFVIFQKIQKFQKFSTFRGWRPYTMTVIIQSPNQSFSHFPSNFADFHRIDLMVPKVGSQMFFIFWAYHT